jgi:hypothetical protein
VEPPPPEAYTTVTNPERFRPLHDVARAVVEDLVARFDVDVDVDRDVSSLFRSEVVESVGLIPRDSAAAPLAVGWTGFPGLVVKFGRWHQNAYPDCGCDACDEQLDVSAELFRLAVDDVVHGRFHERFDGTWVMHEFDRPDRRAGKSLVTYRSAAEIAAYGEPTTFWWRPWPTR